MPGAITRWAAEPRLPKGVKRFGELVSESHLGRLSPSSVAILLNPAEGICLG